MQRGLKPAVFLDRDGTLITEANYLTRPEQVHLLPGIGPALTRLHAAGFACVVVSNQSAVGRGLMTDADLELVHAEVLRQLAAVGATLDGAYYCPAPPSEHPERKPEPGMLLRAARELNLDLGRSWMVGDSLRDLEAGRRAGCRGGILVRTGHPLADDLVLPGADCCIVEDLAAAVDVILAAEPGSASGG